jgi:hypothetical protein
VFKLYIPHCCECYVIAITKFELLHGQYSQLHVLVISREVKNVSYIVQNKYYIRKKKAKYIYYQNFYENTNFGARNTRICYLIYCSTAEYEKGKLAPFRTWLNALLNILRTPIRLKHIEFVSVINNVAFICTKHVQWVRTFDNFLKLTVSRSRANILVQSLVQILPAPGLEATLWIRIPYVLRLITYCGGIRFMIVALQTSPTDTNYKKGLFVANSSALP